MSEKVAGQGDSQTPGGIPDVNRKDDQFGIKVKDDQGSQTPSDGATKPAVKDPDADVPFHKHPRFKEVTTQNRELKETVSGLQSKLAELTGKISEFDAKQNKSNLPQMPSRIEKMIEKRMALGMTESEAKEDVANYLEEVEDRIASRLKTEVSPFRESAEEVKQQRLVKELQKQADDMLSEFQVKLKEDDGVEWDDSIDKKMNEVFKSMPNEWRVAVARDKSMAGLRLIYNNAKDALEKEAQLNKNGTGNAGGKRTGAGQNDGKVHASWVRGLSADEAMKQKPMIEQAYREGRYVQD